MARFVYTGDEYVNVDHIVSIDTLPDSKVIWVHLDTGNQSTISAKYLKDIVQIPLTESGDVSKER